jgi:predicted ATPase
VYQRGLVPQAHYLFKHALIQDTAYQSLLKSSRQQYHHQIAQVLEERFPETTETQPELLAHHYTEAGLIEQAISYWQKAGERTTQRSANVEAIAHLTRGLELLKTLPDTPEHVQQELTLQIALSDALITVKGEMSPDVEKTVLRARELCQQLDETPQLFPVLWRLVIFYINRGELQTTYQLAEQMMRLAQGVQDPELLWIAHFALGAPSLWLGELVSARRHLEQAIALSDDPQTRLRLTIGTADSRVNCLFYTAWTLWHLGYPDQALKKSQEAIALAEGLSHPYSLAVALGFAALFHLFRRDAHLARERAEAVITLSTEQGFSLYLMYGMTIRGWTLTEQEQVEEGIAQMRQNIGSVLCPYELAEAYGKVGQVEKGLTVLTETQAFIDKTGWRVKEAELYRVKGTLTLQSKVQSLESKVQEAEACFLKAIDIARKQQATSLELRAATSLARLWQQQGKRTEAHKLLSEIYNWFTEGFDTKDLQEAKALLDSLSSARA